MSGASNLRYCAKCGVLLAPLEQWAEKCLLCMTPAQAEKLLLRVTPERSRAVHIKVVDDEATQRELERLRERGL